MAKVLLFNSHNEAIMRNVEVKDGVIEVEGKRFFVGAYTPLLIKGRFGYEPLYILKWDSLVPSKNLNPLKPELLKKLFEKHKKETNEEKGERKNSNAVLVEPEWDNEAFLKKKLTPELVKRLVDIKLMGGMIPLKRSTPVNEFVWIAIGALLGAGLIWALVSSGAIHI